jgi:polar amino acid transport system permease protein/polar amino acid transport system substrate-binding protein
MNVFVVFSRLAAGFEQTLLIFALTLLFSLPLGLLVAFCRMSQWRPLRSLTKFYISVMRGTPLMLQLMVVFYGPTILTRHWATPINLDRFAAAIIGFSVNYAAYFAEIYRGGIEAVPQGQYEAAQLLGLGRAQTFLRIIFPQMVKNVLPAVSNEVITLVKDTSLAFAIAHVEMFQVAKNLVARYSSLLPYLGAGAFYYAANLLVAFGMERLERRVNPFRRAEILEKKRQKARSLPAK